MTTTDSRRSLNSGIAPSLNGIVAGLSLFFVYVIRIGTIEESLDPSLWLLPLILTTDFVVPLLAAIWLLAVPTWRVYEAVR